MGTLCFGMGIFSCFTLAPKEEAVLLDYGKYNGTLKEPGIAFFFLHQPHYEADFTNVAPFFYVSLTYQKAVISFAISVELCTKLAQK
jgi:hypothetical protein